LFSIHEQNNAATWRKIQSASASQKFLASFSTFSQNIFASMKAKIIVTPKKAVVDPQGKTVQNALEHMGYRGIKAVHVGKYLEVELDGGDKESARKSLDEACHKFLSNPVIEDYQLEIAD
jgi:phosphoribosylformylglycinamidine synthase